MAGDSEQSIDEQISELWRVVGIFERATGAKINKDKTEGLAVGALRQRQLREEDLPHSDLIGWIEEGKYTKVLGAPLGNDFDVNEYWNKIYQTFIKRLASWRHRIPCMVPESRVPILASLCLSLFWYQAQTLCPSQALGSQIKRDAGYFIFNRRPKFGTDEDGGNTRGVNGATGEDSERKHRKWLAAETMTRSKQHGGLGITNWDAQVGAMQAQWVIRYLSPQERPWRPLLDYYFLPEAGPRGRFELLSTLPLSPILARMTPGSIPTSDPNHPNLSIRARKLASHPILKFWRAAFAQFRRLQWEEEENRLDSHGLADSMFDSPYLKPPDNVKFVKYWKTACGIHHYRDMINPSTGDFYTPLELHRSITGSTRTRNEFPKLYKGMTIEIARAEFNALVTHVGAYVQSQARPFLTDEPSWEPKIGEIVGWIEVSSDASAGIKRARNTNNETETTRYGKVLKFEKETSTVNVLPMRINHYGHAVTIVPDHDVTNPDAIQKTIDEDLPIDLHLRDIRSTVSLKDRIWGLADCTDLDPLNTRLPEIPGIAPAIPFARVKVSDIAKRLSHSRSKTPRAQTTWPSKLGFNTTESSPLTGTNSSKTCSLDSFSPEIAMYYTN